MREEAKEIAKIYKESKGLVKPVIDYLDSRKKVWKKNLKFVYLKIIEHFGKQSFENLENVGKSDDVNSLSERKSFNPYKEDILKWSDDVAARRATLITGASKDRANYLITRGLRNEKIVEDIAKDLEEVYTVDSEYRSMRMARTEVVGASNYGSYAGAKQSINASRTKKRWVSARDMRVRDDHRNVDGQSVWLDDYFTVGFVRMKYPGDPSAPAGQVIHCRCNLSYQVVHEKVSDVYEGEYGPDFQNSVYIIENEIKDRKTEKAICIDRNGKRIFEKSGGKRSVGFTKEESSKMVGEILIHNHPNGTSFSDADILCAKSLDLKEIRAVGKEYRYILKKNVNTGWPDSYHIVKSYKKYFEVHRRRIWENPKTVELDLQEKAMIVFHKVNEDVAKELQMIYIREKINF